MKELENEVKMRNCARERNVVDLSAFLKKKNDVKIALKSLIKRKEHS